MSFKKEQFDFLPQLIDILNAIQNGNDPQEIAKLVIITFFF